MDKKLMKSKKLTYSAKILGSSIFVALFAFFGTAEALYGQDKIVWYSMQQAQQLARQHNKKVLVYAGANWCIYCQKMDEEVFPKPRVIDSLNTYFYGVRVNIESRAPMLFNKKQTTQAQFARRHRVRATPTFIFLNSDGSVIGAQPGFIPAKTFSQLLGYIGSEAYKQIEFGTYLNKYANK